MSGTKEKNPASTQALHIDDKRNDLSNSDPPLNKNSSSKNVKSTYRSLNYGDNSSGVQQLKRFWVIKAKDERVKLAKTDPFIIDLSLKGMVGDYKSVKALQSGHLLIEVDQLSHANNLAKTTRLHDIDVDISPHFSLNSSKAIIFCDHLDKMELEDIKTKLNSQGVCDVHRIIPRNNDGSKSNLYILTLIPQNRHNSSKLVICV